MKTILIVIDSIRCKLTTALQEKREELNTDKDLLFNLSIPF